jgi:hypothetical protein
MELTNADIDCILDVFEMSKDSDAIDAAIAILRGMKSRPPPKIIRKPKRRPGRIRRAAYAQSARRDIRREPR